MVNFASQEKKSCWEMTPHCDFVAVLEGRGCMKHCLPRDVKERKKQPLIINKTLERLYSEINEFKGREFIWCVS